MLRGCLAVLLTLAGAFFLGALLSADSCDDDAAAGPFFIAGLLCAGGAAFTTARALTHRAWIAWTCAVVTLVVVGVGVSVLSLLQWVEACAN